MKFISSLGFGKTARYIFLQPVDNKTEKAKTAKELNEIEAGQALDYSREEQNKLGATIGTHVDLKELKGELVNVRVVQKKDSVSAITLGFAEAGLLKLSNLYEAKARYRKGMVSQKQIDNWNRIVDTNDYPASWHISKPLAEKIKNGEDIPMGYANVLSAPGNFVTVENEKTVLISDEKPEIVKEEKDSKKKESPKETKGPEKDKKGKEKKEKSEGSAEGKVGVDIEDLEPEEVSKELEQGKEKLEKLDLANMSAKEVFEKMAIPKGFPMTHEQVFLVTGGNYVVATALLEEYQNEQASDTESWYHKAPFMVPSRRERKEIGRRMDSWLDVISDKFDDWGWTELSDKVDDWRVDSHGMMQVRVHLDKDGKIDGYIKENLKAFDDKVLFISKNMPEYLDPKTVVGIGKIKNARERFEKGKLSDEDFKDFLGNIFHEYHRINFLMATVQNEMNYKRVNERLDRDFDFSNDKKYGSFRAQVLAESYNRGGPFRVAQVLNHDRTVFLADKMGILKEKGEEIQDQKMLNVWRSATNEIVDHCIAVTEGGKDPNGLQNWLKKAGYDKTKLEKVKEEIKVGGFSADATKSNTETYTKFMKDLTKKMDAQPYNIPMLDRFNGLDDDPTKGVYKMNYMLRGMTGLYDPEGNYAIPSAEKRVKEEFMSLSQIKLEIIGITESLLSAYVENKVTSLPVEKVRSALISGYLTDILDLFEIPSDQESRKTLYEANLMAIQKFSETPLSKKYTNEKGQNKAFYNWMKRMVDNARLEKGVNFVFEKPVTALSVRNYFEKTTLSQSEYDLIKSYAARLNTKKLGIAKGDCTAAIAASDIFSKRQTPLSDLIGGRNTWELSSSPRMNMVYRAKQNISSFHEKDGHIMYGSPSKAHLDALYSNLGKTAGKKKLITFVYKYSEYLDAAKHKNSGPAMYQRYANKLDAIKELRPVTHAAEVVGKVQYSYRAKNSGTKLSALTSYFRTFGNVDQTVLKNIMPSLGLNPNDRVQAGETITWTDHVVMDYTNRFHVRPVTSMIVEKFVPVDILEEKDPS